MVLRKSPLYPQEQGGKAIGEWDAVFFLITIPHIAIPPFMIFKVKKAHKDRRGLPDALCAQLFMPNIPAGPPLCGNTSATNVSASLSGVFSQNATLTVLTLYHILSYIAIVFSYCLFHPFLINCF